ILDSYPASSSHSYPEWENWTAKRGIRGVTYGDERLRRVISRLRWFEKCQDSFEQQIISSAIGGAESSPLKKIQVRAIMNSLERYDFVNKILQDRYAQNYAGYYQLINRVRNLAYQEDPKWASRHPSYGSSPYYDMQGLAYLEIAARLLDHLRREAKVSEDEKQTISIADWDFDGRDEIIMFNRQQSLAIDTEGGCVHYHHVLAADLAEASDRLAFVLNRDFAEIDAYHSVYRYACPIVMTETDSSLKAEIFPEGARKENCRNSMRCSLVMDDNSQFVEIGDFDRAIYKLEEFFEGSDYYRVLLSCIKNINVNGQAGIVTISKEYMLKDDGLSLIIKARLDNLNTGKIYLVPQVVSSAAPSDEIDFHPVAWLGLPEGEGDLKISIRNAVEWNKTSMVTVDKSFLVQDFNDIDYVFQIKSGNGDHFTNRINYKFSGDELEKIEVRPAVENYYTDLVFEGQSRLGYQSSGLMLMPYIPLKDGSVEFCVDITWELNFNQDSAIKKRQLYLIENFRAE
ncbi:MAG: hypothetical protein H6Q64_2342, partial [Firmicutes bacterium]|nr:hypothetical protein [Bacillota bacterium]